MNIGVFANTSWYIYNFRLNTMKALREQGHNVIAIGPADGYVEKIKAEGFQHVEITMKGSGTNPFFELGTLYHLFRCFRNNNTDLVLSFTPKANIYAALLSAPLRMYTFSNVSGLGRLFIKPTLLTIFVKYLYKAAFLFSEHVFFQNEDDQKLFLSYGITKKYKTSILPGSGVDLEKFFPAPRRPGKQKTGLEFLLVSRMLWDKGINEFITAARTIKKDYPDTRFSLLGEMGADNPSSIPRKEIEAWVKEGVVNYLGKTNDVHQYLLKADCIVLPSYREGTPRSLLEAAATAKPVITTDTPGCRNVVDDRVTGYLCKAKDATDLAEKMQSIIQMSEQERLEFGRLARQKMEIQFDEKTVIEKYFSALQDVPPGGYKIRSKLIKYMTS